VKEMGHPSVEAMILARGPDFVEQEGAAWLDRAMQVVSNAALFAASGRDQRAELPFEQGFLARLGA
jgi:hypothetical protein